MVMVALKDIELYIAGARGRWVRVVLVESEHCTRDSLVKRAIAPRLVAFDRGMNGIEKRAQDASMLSLKAVQSPANRCTGPDTMLRFMRHENPQCMNGQNAKE